MRVLIGTDLLDLSQRDIENIINNKHKLSKVLKFYPLDAPGISVPGIDFVEIAKVIYPDNDLNKSIEKFYFHCLYSARPILLSVSDGKKKYDGYLIRGHFYGSYEYGPLGQADVIVIGKIPGFEEYKQDRNFCGPSGIRLFTSLKEVGFTEDQLKRFYLTNVVRFYVDYNSARIPNRWIDACKPLLDQELRILRPKAILLLGNEAVKAVFGYKTTLNSIITSNPVIEIPLHRSDKDEKEFHRAQVFAAMHPAAVCRNPELLPAFEGQLSKLFQFLSTGNIVVKNDSITYEVITKREDLERCVNDVTRGSGIKKIAVDLEWQGFFPKQNGAFVRTLQLCRDYQKAYVIKLFDENGNFCFDCDINTVKQILKRIFEADDVQLGGAFFITDLSWLEDWFGFEVSKLFKEISFEQFEGGNYPGIFDIAIAEHAHNEVGPFDLESLAILRANYSNWSSEVEQWKTQYCSDRDIPKKELLGYGPCPDDILIPYAAMDVIVTRELMDIECSLLNSDRYKHNCWLPFYRAMMAYPAFYEMHKVGILIDPNKLKELSLFYSCLYAERLQEFRELIKWPTFNPRSVIYDCIELLFGEKYIGGRRRPEGAISLYLEPFKSTDGRLWSLLTEEEKQRSRPSTDKEVCSILAASNPIAAKLRDLRLIDQVLKTVLRTESDEEGHIKQTGIGRFIMDDGRVHSLFMPIIETGRANSVRPQMQNLAKQQEATYKKISGEKYPGPLRSIVIARENYKLIEADYKIAELMCMAILSRDKNLLDHCLRSSTLDEDDPNYYDIHSNIAVKAFGLDCRPTKKALKELGLEHLRVAAKAIVYGSLYGRGVEAIYRQCLEEGVSVTIEDIKQLIDTFFGTYPKLVELQERLKFRVEDPGWIRTVFGRYRRFVKADDPEIVAAQQREAMNFPAQSMVADIMNNALRNLYFNPLRPVLKYRILAQIHDSCLLEVPAQYVDDMVNKIIPECLCEKNKFKAADLDGNPYPDSELYSLGVDIKVLDRWDV